MRTTNRSVEDTKVSNEEMLNWWVYQVLLPIAMALMALCFILGTILIIKSYIMTRLRTNIMTEMRRRRRTGPAPSNTYYVGTNEMTTPRFQDSDNNDRRSTIPSVLSLATQGTAWQRQSELSEWVTVN